LRQWAFRRANCILGLGVAGVFVAGLFGPAQVASRLVNMLFGTNIRQTLLAFGATASLAFGLAVLLITTPSIVGAMAFAILFGFGSGLMSIVGGTLPLELFGRAGYGAYVGWIAAARQLGLRPIRPDHHDGQTGDYPRALDQCADRPSGHRRFWYNRAYESRADWENNVGVKCRTMTWVDEVASAIDTEKEMQYAASPAIPT
jgi:hypothetical protein